MTKLLDFKAIAFGLATFVAAQLLVTLFSRFIMNTMWIPPEKGRLILFMVAALVPAIAGFVSAWTARSHRIINGVIGGTLLMVLLVVFYIPFIKVFLSWGVPFLFVALTGLLAFLGAALGSYLRGKRDAKR